MKQIVEFSSDEQTKTLNRILSKDKDKYSLYDIFENLPFDITYHGENHGERGYLSIGRLGIEYSSICYDEKLKLKLNVVFFQNTDYYKTNIFDCFINTLKWLKENESCITVNFWN